MRVLITGITGMAGSHLAEYLLPMEGVEVYGTYRTRSRLDNLQDLARGGKLNLIEGRISGAEALARLAQPGSVTLVEADLLDAWSTRTLLEAVRPERIFHLAAQSFVPLSFSAPAQTLQTNILAQVNLLEAARELSLASLIHVAGSSEEYGLVLEHELPIKETNPLRPLSPYAVSKVTQELLARQYFYSYGLKTVVTRGFNHTGPRRGPMFVTSSLAKQIAEIEAGLRPPVVVVGDLTPSRDWSDVRDVVRAYWLALEKGQPGEVYNVGAGVPRQVGEVLDILLSMTSVAVQTQHDPARLRPSDVKMLWADCTKFKKQTGWEPQIPFEQTMRDLLDYWRAKSAEVPQPAGYYRS